jgi:hypothetical protein
LLDCRTQVLVNEGQHTISELIEHLFASQPALSPAPAAAAVASPPRSSTVLSLNQSRSLVAVLFGYLGDLARYQDETNPHRASDAVSQVLSFAPWITHPAAFPLLSSGAFCPGIACLHLVAFFTDARVFDAFVG